MRTCATYLLLVGSSLEALAFSPLFGIVVWLCMQALTGRRAIAIEFVSTFFVAIIAEYLNSIGFHIPVWTMGIAAVLLFVQGLSISNALECFAFNDLVSGMSFLGQAILSVIKLFSGIFIGISFGDALLNTSAVPYTNELPFYSSAIGAVLLATNIGILFNIRPKDIWRGVPVIALGTLGPTLFSFDHGWFAATWITATLITLYSTWVAKNLKLIGNIFMVQGIILMVPGSRILVSAGQNFYEATLLPIPSVGESAALIFSAIVVGQITAHAIYAKKIER